MKWAWDARAMSPMVIVSYDDTHNDHDALALGRILGETGASIALAYVRHQPSSERGNELLAEHEAQDLLARGAAQLGRPEAARRVVVNASTPDGLRELAVREGADVVVFGSEYRTAEGSVQPGTSAQRLLDGGPVAIAISPAGLRSRRAAPPVRIGVLDAAGDAAAAGAARRTQTRPAPARSAPSGGRASSPRGAVAGPAPITTSAARTPARPAAPASTAERTSAKSTGVSPSASTAATAARRSASPTATTATVAASTPARLSSARVTSRPD